MQSEQLLQKDTNKSQGVVGNYLLLSNKAAIGPTVRFFTPVLDSPPPETTASNPCGMSVDEDDGIGTTSYKGESHSFAATSILHFLCALELAPGADWGLGDQLLNSGLSTAIHNNLNNTQAEEEPNDCIVAGNVSRSVR